MGNAAFDFYEQSRLINHSIAIEPEGGGGTPINGACPTRQCDTEPPRSRAPLR